MAPARLGGPDRGTGRRGGHRPNASPLQHQETKTAPFQPTSFFGSGDFRMAAASLSNTLSVQSTAGEVDVLHLSFSVPSGHREDIAAFFNAEAYQAGNGYCYLNFELDQVGSTPIHPGNLWVTDGYVYNGAYPTISAQGFKASVGPGLHFLYVTMYASGADCTLYNRSLIVLGNKR